MYMYIQERGGILREAVGFLGWVPVLTTWLACSEVLSLV